MPAYNIGSGGNFPNISASVPSLVNGDTLNLLDAAPIVESSDSVFSYLNGITIQSAPGNTSKPVVQLGDNIRIRIHDYSVNFLFKGITFKKDNPTQQFFDVQPWESGGQTFDSCDFVEVVGSSYANPILSLQGSSNGYTIRNCLFSLKGGKAIGVTEDLRMFNNVIYGQFTDAVTVMQDWLNIAVYNNIFFGLPGGNGIVGDVHFTKDVQRNVFYGLTGVATPPSYNAFGSKFVDPIFRDAPNGDFLLGVGSPCIDAGCNVGKHPDMPTVDARGVSRPQEIPNYFNEVDGNDIGMFEMLPSEFDNVPPANWPGYPKVKAAILKTVDFCHKVSESSGSGTWYVVVLSATAATPTPAQVKAGQDSAGTPVPAGHFKSKGVVTNVEATLQFDVVYPKNQYKMFSVVEDVNNNLQATVDVLPFEPIIKIAHGLVETKPGFVTVNDTLGGDDDRDDGEFFVPGDTGVHDADGRTRVSGRYRSGQESVIKKRIITEGGTL